MTDAFGRAVRDHHRGDRTDPLRQGDGEETREHPIEAFYFDAFDPESDAGSWLASRLEGPVVDLGAGAGRHALWAQERFETVAVETSPALVETMRDRGVEDAREGDMFALRDAFERDRFASALAIGTQIGLSGSMGGLSAFLGDLAFVTTPDATAVVDCYDPSHPEATALLGYRGDPTPGLAHRVMWFSYAGTTDPTLHFRLFSPDRLREAALGTRWEVDAIDRSGTGDGPHYRAALRKR
ncbi:SAM-dependent methyltransferase [Halorubrum persicum]|uniref:SAM-dependent methyltransferase n=1 Tax=Halorubrum persicum TaxID=1383844 RepID=A0A2G1WJC5_9EURY|nr:class I SAM-dependent methyltransferase [Halorubrum persicum]PHQ39083.1 SAM-dependent methyltransferase [Halorubrum persicum]